MTDYTKLVKALRICSEFVENPSCTKCAYSQKTQCKWDMMIDAAAAIEALQAEVKDAFNRGYNAGYTAGIGYMSFKREKEPKRGEWIWIQRANGGQYKGCSVCHAPMPTDSMLDYLDDEDCEFCYSCVAKMGVRDGSSR